MSLCPFAVQRLLPESHTQPRISPRVAILHSAAGRGSLHGFFATSSNLESHFWVSGDGLIEQYVDTNVRADANLKANAFAVSIETESSPQATERWPDPQAAAIVRLLDWLCTEHPAIKRQQCPTWDGSGIGWHIMFGTPGPWTPVSKSCPGPARIAQARDEIIPAVTATGSTPPQPEDDMTPDQIAKLNQAAADAKAARGMVAELYDQLIGKQDDAKSETLRQLIKEGARDAKIAAAKSKG